MAKWLKYRTGDREISIRAFIRRKGRFRERFDFHSLPPLRFPPADKTRSHEKNLGSSLGFIKFQNSDPLCSPWISRKEILSVSPAKTGAQCRRKRTRKHGIFEIQLRLVDFSFLSLSLSFSFVRLRTTYKKKGKKKKKLFRLFRQKFSTKYFSRHDGCLVSPVGRKGFSVAGSGNERNGGTGRRSSSSNWFKLVAGTIPVLLHANVNTHPSRMPRVVLMPSNYLLIFLLFIFPFD